jgi:DNA-binding response OmpR family regulator
MPGDPWADVLLIEDDPAVSDMYALRLRSDGYRVRVEADGRRGLAAALRGTFDVILLDLRLPGLHGLDVLHELRRRTSTDVPVIILTNDDCRDKALAAGAQEYLLKSSLTPRRLSQRVARLILAGTRLGNCTLAVTR